MRRHLLRLAVLTMLVAGAVMAPATSAQDRSRVCHRVVVRGYAFGVSVVRGRVTCRIARRVLRLYLDASPHRCAGSHCYIRIRGWDCITASWNRGYVEECSRGRRLVRSYPADV